jgi:hypothetical protein
MDFSSADDFIFSACEADEDGKIGYAHHRGSPSPQALQGLQAMRMPVDALSGSGGLVPAADADSEATARDSAWLAHAKVQLDLLIKQQADIVQACQPDLKRSSNATDAAALKHALDSLQSVLLVASFPIGCGDLQYAPIQLSAVLDQISACRTPLGLLVQGLPEAQHADNGKSAGSALAALARNLDQLQGSCRAWLDKLAQHSLFTIGKTAARCVATATNAAVPAPVDQLDAMATAIMAPAAEAFFLFLDQLDNKMDEPIVARLDPPTTPDQKD